MSKVREQFATPPASGAPLEVAPTGDLKPYVIFTQLKSGGPYIYAGWLEAADDDMALAFAKEHYGQDQECVNVMAIDRRHITSSDGLYGAPLPSGEGSGVRASADIERDPDAPSPQPSPKGRASYQVFTQKKAGDLWLSAGSVEATQAHEAIEAARKALKQATNAHAVWVVPSQHVLSTHGDLIWRHTDQSYRLARGYGREVRGKWIAFRDEKQLAEYEKDDLAEAF
jgi:1,2-phenylacetyl-CoA epoxidase PaaB subunit